MRVAAGVIILVAVAAVLARQAILQEVGDFLLARDPLVRTDAVIAISGNGKERVRTAGRLLQEGYAQWLIVSGGPPGASGSGVELARYAREVGVPEARTLIDETAFSTVGNAEGSARVMRERGLRTAILVSSPYHMRRAILIYRSVFSRAGLTVRAYPAEPSFFEVREWWTRRLDRELVLREYVKLAAYVVGIR